MHGIAQYLIFLFLFFLTACSMSPISSQIGADAAPPSVLEPMSLFAPSTLNLGAERMLTGELMLLVSDDAQRAVDTSQPLLILLGNRTLSLSAFVFPETEERHYQRYEISAQQLHDLSVAEHAGLRLYLLGGRRVEARVAGYASDYLLRPKRYSVQGKLQQFLLQQASAVAEG